MSKFEEKEILVLDSKFVDQVSEQLDVEPVDADRAQKLLARVMGRIESEGVEQSLFDTIRADEGDWIEILPNVYKKTLNIDAGKESYLLRMSPGATAPAHDHDTDELCYVIEGDLAFGDVQLDAGDYHYAHKGSRHGEASTCNGTLLFIQSGIGYQPTG